ncbi:MAG: hypothetical protein NC127_02525 [Muribaculum sp.]|nr:hypothetical protein [Muribaculum sp.]
MLKKAHEVWRSGAMLRARRIRYKKFTFGDQWSDRVATPNGATMTEREYARHSGYNPMTSNVIRSIVKSVVGYFRTLQSERTAYAMTDDYVKETDARTFEEFLVSGCSIQRIAPHADRRGLISPKVEQISPARFFVDSLDDNAEMVGMVHDMSLQALLLRFSHGDKSRSDKLRASFSRQLRADSRVVKWHPAGDSVNDSLDFMHCTVPGKCRVVEVWCRECCERLRCHDPESGSVYYAEVSREKSIKRDNRARRSEGRPETAVRWELCDFWQCRFYMPDGSVIEEYSAERHPFVYRFYPLLDGEVHSFVEDTIEQQRYINRLITLNDRLLAVSAKGVLMIADDQLSDAMPIEVIQENWAAPDGIVLYKSKIGSQPPQQVVGNSSRLGVDNLIDGQMQMLQEVSGVNGAMRGREPSAGTTASLYESQQRGAAVALNDLVMSFDAFLVERDKILLPLYENAVNKS